MEYGQIPAFGSLYAEKTLMDTKCSGYVPQQVLRGAGSVRAHWLGESEKSELVLEKYDAKNREHADLHVGGWESDNYIALVRADGKVASRGCFHAAYQAILLYAVDVDGDGRDEIAVESGAGRGTFVYTKSFQVYRCRPDRIELVFELPLSGYVCGEPRDNRPIPDPDFWERRYAFVRESGNRLGIYAYVIRPKLAPLGVGRQAEDLHALQLDRLFYSWNPALQTFELRHCELRRLE